MKAIDARISDIRACDCCCSILRAILKADKTAQKEFCEKGGIKVIFNVFSEHSYNKNLCALCEVLLELAYSFQDV